MAPRANWKGFLRLSLVTCPVALYPATSDSEKISFNQINRNTGHRIKYTRVDADSGEEVPNEDIRPCFPRDPNVKGRILCEHRQLWLGYRTWPDGGLSMA
jgi:DNA end-binding protein Ku